MLVFSSEALLRSGTGEMMSDQLARGPQVRGRHPSEIGLLKQLYRPQMELTERVQEKFSFSNTSIKSD